MEANAVIADAPQGHIVLVGEVPVVPVQPGAVPEVPVLVAPLAAVAASSAAFKAPAKGSARSAQGPA